MSNVLLRSTPVFNLRLWAAIFGVALASAMAPAKAATLTFGGKAAGNNAGQTNSATAAFALSVSGTTTDLVVTLTNTALFKPNDGPDMLTAVFFTLAGDPTLTKISALLNTNSAGVENGSTLTVPGGVVGGSWAYAAGLSGAPGSANEGISSAGLSLFGSGNLFPGAALPGDSPTPGGVGGALTTSVDDGSQYNGGLSGRPYIKDSAVFTLGNVPASFTLSEISDVSFAYGTTPDQIISAMLVPEPSGVMLAGMGLLLLGLFGRKRR